MKKFQYDSRSVVSNQQGIHENLTELVAKHLRSDYRKPIQTHNLEAYRQMQKAIADIAHEFLILDSCCGTGASSIHLANKYPDTLVIGIDQSYKRLNRRDDQVAIPENCILIRANCEDIWRLCERDSISFAKHFILYPNPWPKSEHFKRRWHGHPVFGLLPNLSCYTELRSNWKIYLDEFSLAWQTVSGQAYSVDELEVAEPMTLFEKKYHESGQKLYQFVADSSLRVT
ncbi:SAM-dependent methyltransferase [Aliikangiella marina]|uniref:tRNA (guanine(46)-N(7))-methyltransferase n=1 Tax=Aliikangiella marina TaxID=1712262 RepID=A0A545TCP0_9GAMM|nr:SAM-dependent methyltransferase [Aliikangiella marina]TQV74961.1 SAM-dependent methyltransferase [Aliikangiella marina]